VSPALSLPRFFPVIPTSGDHRCDADRLATWNLDRFHHANLLEYGGGITATQSCGAQCEYRQGHDIGEPAIVSWPNDLSTARPGKDLKRALVKSRLNTYGEIHIRARFAAD
jgi:hypothetical protein